MNSFDDITPTDWWDAEPARFARDRDEIMRCFPELAWSPTAAGTWAGVISMWPFDRPQPEGLAQLLDGKGLHLVIAYRQAYPVVPPRIYPIDPRPEPIECTQHRWHVNGDGSLCQFQTETAWDPRNSICDLIRKAAAWRVEYALMKAGTLEEMTLQGIASDASLDDLIADAGGVVDARGQQSE